MVVALPDVTGAMIARLRAAPEVAALAGTRVSAALNDAWAMPAYAVLLRKAGGPPPDESVQWQRQRFDVHCYGPDARTADLLWRTVQAVLCPYSGRSFVAAATRVLDVVREGGPTPIVEPDTGWAKVLASYVATYQEVPA